MGYCTNCGFRVPRGQEECERCANLDFTYIDDDERPIDPERIRWADSGGYVVEANWRWSSVEYVAIPDPDDIDDHLEHEDETRPGSFVGLLPLLRRRRK